MEVVRRGKSDVRVLLRSGTILLAIAISLLWTPIQARQVRADEMVTRPLVSEEAAPLESIAPTGPDGSRGEGFLRKPPGRGPFPAVVLLHGGIVRWSSPQLKDYALGTWTSRFLAAGYVVAVITYRSRDIDPQSLGAVQDAVGAIDYLRTLPCVDRESIAVSGASGGGDLALWAASSTKVAAVVAEEPASSMFLGVMNSATPRKGARFTPEDGFAIHADPAKFFTPAYRKVAQARIARINSPILIVQGEETSRLNVFNRETLLPELRAAKKIVDVKSYSGEPHSFAFYSTAARTPHPAVAARVFDDVNGWLQERLRRRPTPIDPSFVKQVPF
jgi:dipeptidyl aminopeptidase/acylaminoacyl peptidase